MSRWLWGLLAGVVLVAIAAVFWIDQTSVTTPGFARPNACRSRAGSAGAACSFTGRQGTRPRAGLRPNCAGTAPSLRSHLRPRPRSRPQPRPLRRRRPLLTRRPMQDSKPPRRPRRPPRSPRLPPSSRRSLRLLPLRWPNHPCRRPRPDGRRRKSRAYMRPRALRSWSGPGPIPRRIASGSSSGAAAAGPIGSRWTSSPRPRLSSSPKRILLPSAICRIDGASEAEGALKVSADCEDFD